MSLSLSYPAQFRIWATAVTVVLALIIIALIVIIIDRAEETTHRARARRARRRDAAAAQAGLRRGRHESGPQPVIGQGAAGEKEFWAGAEERYPNVRLVPGDPDDEDRRRLRRGAADRLADRFPDTAGCPACRAEHPDADCTCVLTCGAPGCDGEGQP